MSRIGAAILLILPLAHSLTAAEPSARELLEEAQDAIGQGDSKTAVKKATAAIEADPKLALAYYFRGRENFRLGEVKASVADFDRYVALEPAAESRQWERGISMYYADQFKRGAAQFELYQTYHDNDVENSVWRYLCVARSTGVKQAEKNILPIRNDRRPAMMDIFELYRGNRKPEQVVAVADAVEGENSHYAAQFYMHLYVGLYYEVHGQEALANKHIALAAKHDKPTPGINRYMWDVARIHHQRFQAADAKAPTP